jgi:hypothetical protein
MGVSSNRGTPKSSILIGFSIINNPFWGISSYGNLQVYHQTCSDLDTLDAWGTPRQPMAPCDKFSGLHRGVAQIRAGATEVAPELLPHLGPARPKKDIGKSMENSMGNPKENPETSAKNDDFIRGK